MKTSKDPRHIDRIKAMQELFAWDFNPVKSVGSVRSVKSVEEIIKHIKKIDKKIEEAAPTWPISKINKIDLAILRLATYELLVESKVPTKVAVDEAVELAKEYGADASASFVNRALGKLIEVNQIKVD